jgi:hypothetical protein
MSFSTSSAAGGASSCAADCGGGGASFSADDSGGDSGVLGTSSTVANPLPGSISTEPLSPEEEELEHRLAVKKTVWQVKRAKMRWKKIKSQVAEHVFRRKSLV